MLMATQTSGQSVGVCYGMLGDNLPPPSEIVEMYKSNNIRRMRIYYPSADAFNALRGSDIQLAFDVDNTNLRGLATYPNGASTFIAANVKPYPDVAFRYIVVGNEAVPGLNAQHVLPAMQNIHTALSAVGLQDKIKVTTSVFMGVLNASYPPSAGVFTSDAAQYMGPIVQFLLSKGSPLLVNVYTYHSYLADPEHIALPYALFTSPGTVVKDGPLEYQNLFDATTDALYWALEKTGGSAIEIVVSETGWPTAGGLGATTENAQTYNSNLIKHAANGTPKRPKKIIEAYIFAMFDEDQKRGEVHQENHYGLFHADKTPAYPITF